MTQPVASIPFNSIKRTLLSELVFDKKEPFRINSSQSVEDLVQLLNREKILSVPVWDHDKQQYIGMVGVFDVVALLAFGSTKQQLGKDPIQLSELSSMDFTTLLDTVDSIHPKANHRQIFTLEPTETLLSLQRPFVQAGIHRLLVKVNHIPLREQCPYRILSQSDVVRFLVKNSEKLHPDFLRATVSSLGLVAGSIDSKILNVEPLFNGFQWLYLTPNPSALAVVDEYGKLVGTLSVSDVRDVSLQNVTETLAMSVGDFLRQRRQAQQVTCTPDSSLAEVMKSLVDNQVHRVWVVDQGGKPIGVVTLTDIIRLFLTVQPCSE